MSDRILGGVCVLVAAGMAWSAHGYAAAISYEPVGPRAFPTLLALLLALCGAWLMFRPAPGEARLPLQQIKLLGMLAVAVLAYALLFEKLGFVLATTAMAVPVGMAFGGSWKRCLIGGFSLGLVLYLMFDKLLDVVLPSGLLSFIFGGR